MVTSISSGHPPILLISLEESSVKYIRFCLPVLWLSFTLLAACAQVENTMDYFHIGTLAAKPPKAYVFECADDYAFSTSIEGTTAWLFLPEQTIKLPHVFSVSGSKFSAKQTTLWVEKGEARLKIDSTTHEACINNPAKAVWAHARLNGVDFRAVGNEPSWILEIVKGESIIFADFYGKVNKYMFIRYEPTINQTERKTVFKTSNKHHSLLITIIGIPCQDKMSSEQFEFSVTVELDEKYFTGCGRALH